MIADNDRGTFFRNILKACWSDAIHEADNDPGEESHQEFGQQTVNINGHERVESGDDQEQFRNRQPDKLQQNDRYGAGADHEDRVDNVVGRNDARHVLAL